MDDEIEEVLRARDTSFWLLGALQSALERDPVDALHDAQLLARLMTARVNEVFLRQSVKQLFHRHNQVVQD